MPSSPSDSHDPPPYDDMDDPLISKPERSAKPPISFDSQKQFWSNMASLSWRCLTTVFSLSLLIIGLHAFSRMGKLSRMEQRWFNAITILLGAFASLGLGSLLGYLGSMLRWSLLAREKYKMQNIELLLAMPSPTGSAKLLYKLIREGRRSQTTLVVMLYLFFNITGRFSVAIFGLTYNLVDDLVEDPPTYTTNWTSSVLLTKNAMDFEVVEKSLLSYLDLVRGGLATVSLDYRQEITLDVSGPQTLDPIYKPAHPNPRSALNVNGIPLEDTSDNGDFTYEIPEFVGEKSSPGPLVHAVHSSTNCTMLRLDSYKYWRKYGSDNQTSKDWKDEKNGEVIAQVLRVLDSRNAWPHQDAKHAAWAAPLAGKSNGSSLTYVVYGETAWECISSLSETLDGDPHPKPLFDSAALFLLPIVERVGLGGALGQTNNSCDTPLVGGTNSVVYRLFTDLKRKSSPSAGVQALNFYQNGTGGSTTQNQYYNRYIARLIASLPVSAIAYGTEILPRIYKDPEAYWTDHVETTLEVKWDRVFISAGTILTSQILMIIAVVYYSRNVYVREDSFLTTAELLKTVLNKIGDGNLMTAKELGDSLDKVLGGPVRYGTIPGPQGGPQGDPQGDPPRVALGGDVEYKFPRFPTFRRRSIFRW